MSDARSQIAIRQLTAAEIPFGLALSTAANWNQLQADWRRVVALEPAGCFIAALDGRDVGTVTAIVFDSVAWIGLMLVDPSVRRRGVGRALMERALAWLDERKVPTVRLDATPLGQPLYEQLGFTLEYLLDRFAGVPQLGDRPPAPCEVNGWPAGAHDASSDLVDQLVEQLARFDQRISGANRGEFLARVASEWPEESRVARDGEAVVGLQLARRGRSATLIGPCLASRPAVGDFLLCDALRRFAGQAVFIDIPRSHVAARTLASDSGLVIQRPLARMTRGPQAVERVESIWAGSGPEKG